MASARSVAVRLLSRRDYTTAELREKLAERGFGAADIDAAIAELAAEQLLDDRRTAAAHIRTASRVKTRGRLRIQQELQARGVDGALVRELLGDLTQDDEAAALERFLRRRSVPPTIGPAGRRRLFQQLLRRGFTADLIAKALKHRSEDH